ncbi:hypothetical protein K2Z84_10595, partial [Candidatus Binatia bacterium]|nr:hypothetical protein [Candidatus Binatia bacterium]
RESPELPNTGSVQLYFRRRNCGSSASAEYDLERRRVDSLIDALERGQRVSPEEVEDAVGDARRAPF